MAGIYRTANVNNHDFRPPVGVLKVNRSNCKNSQMLEENGDMTFL